jgi:tetratricopeptide (TPR) repeat protein
MEEVWRGYRELYESAENEATARRRYDSPIAAAENNLANGYATLGRVAQARVFAASSVERRERAAVVRPLGVATSLSNLGIMDIRLGEVERGLAVLLEIDAFYQSFARFGVPYRLRVARLQREIGFAYLRQGDRAQARQRLLAGLTELIDLNELRDDHYPRTLFMLGYYHLEGGELTEAVTRFREANAATRPSDDQLRILLDVMLGEALVRRDATSDEGVILLRRAQEALAALPPDAEYVVHFSRRELRDRVNRALLAQ